MAGQSTKETASVNFALDGCGGESQKFGFYPPCVPQISKHWIGRTASREIEKHPQVVPSP
jgi:hypothetical protein